MDQQYYPSWRYHATLPPQVVRDEEQDAILGPDWADSPAAFTKPVPAKGGKPPAKKKAEQKDKDS